MKEVVIFGTGGHAKVIYDILSIQKVYRVVSFISLNEVINQFKSIPHISQRDFERSGFEAGIVAVGDNFARNQVVNFIKSVKPNFEFITAVHHSSTIAADVTIGSGTVVMAGAVINSDSKIGSHVIINTASTVDHDCDIGQFSSIAPGCTLGGNVSVSEFTAVSLGSKIIHGIQIGSHTVIGAGSVVVNDIDNLKIAYGNPCRIVRSRNVGEKYL